MRDNKYLIGNKHAVGSKPNKTSFKKGTDPWNKGKKGIHLSPETEFKKGQPSLKKMPVGSVTIRQTKGGKPRKFIKTADPSEWVENARHVWLSNGGLIPKGFIVHHIDENTLNDDISNLALVNRAGHLNIHRKDWRTGDEEGSFWE
jgi:hypothetical protein